MRSVLIILTLFIACLQSYGQARQRGIIEFNSITELKNTPLQPQDSDFAVVVSADTTVKELYNYEAVYTPNELDSYALDNFTGSWVRVSDGIKTEYTQLSGRFEIDVDYDWASWSDVNWGPSFHDWDTDIADSGPNGQPAIDWDGIGLFFPKNAILKRLYVKVKGNNNDVDLVEFFIRAHDTDLEAGIAIDTNGEIGAVDITPTIVTLDIDAGAALGADFVGHEISLNDYSFQNNGDLHVYARAAVGSLTANRQLRCTLFIEWEMPQ